MGACFARLLRSMVRARYRSHIRDDGMELRTRVSTALKEAMKAKEADRLSTLRLITAAIKDRDIEARGEGKDEGVGDAVFTHTGPVTMIIGSETKTFTGYWKKGFDGTIVPGAEELSITEHGGLSRGIAFCIYARARQFTECIPAI